MQVQTSQRIIYWILVTILVLIPLVSWNGLLFSYTVTKTLLFSLLIEIGLIFWIPLILLFPQFRPRWTPVLIVTSAFFGVAALSTFIGQDISASLWGGYERMMGLWTFAHFYIFFLILISVVRTRENWRRLVNVFLSVASIVGFIGIVESFSSSGRIISTIGNAAFLASYIALAVGIAVWLLTESLSQTSKKQTRILYGTSLGILLLALYLTEARSGILGVAAGFVALAIVLLFNRDDAAGYTFISPGMLKKIIGGVLVVTVLSVGGLVMIGGGASKSNTFSRLLSIPSLMDRTTQGRLLVWQVSTEGWKEHFLFGWGIENYALLFNKYYDIRLHDQEPWFDRAHNIVFDIGTTTGVVGLATYLGSLVAAVYMVFKAYASRHIHFWTYASIIAFFVIYGFQNLFTFDTITSYFSLFFMLAFVAVLPHVSEQKSEPLDRRKVSWMMVGLVTIPIMFIFYQTAWLPVRENIAAAAGLRILAQGEPDDLAIQQFEHALSYNTYGDVDVRRMFAEYVFDFIKQEGKRPPESLAKLLAYSMQKMDENIAADPENVKWLMYQGQLYSLATHYLGQNQAAKTEEYILRAKALSSERAQIYLELANARKLQGNISGMWQALDELLTKTPEYVVGHANAATHAIELGDTAREAREVAWLDERGAASDLLRDAYFRAKKYPEAIRFQQKIIEDKIADNNLPEEISLEYAHLAAFYQLAGDKENASAAALKVVEYDPNRRAEADAFLNAL